MSNNADSDGVGPRGFVEQGEGVCAQAAVRAPQESLSLSVGGGGAGSAGTHGVVKSGTRGVTTVMTVGDLTVPQGVKLGASGHHY